MNFSCVRRAGPVIAAAIVSGVFCGTPASHAGDWPEWRGPTRSGAAVDERAPTVWSPTRNIRWRTDLPGPGNSTPIISKGRVFLTQSVEKENRRTLMCFDRRDGTLLWQSGVTHSKPERTHRTNPYCSASPATDGERIVVTFGSAGVLCYGFDGEQLWRRDLGEQDHEWGYASSPVLFNDLCIVYHGPGKGSFLTALNKETGETAWRVDEPEPETEDRTDNFRGNPNGISGTWSTPILIDANGRTELIMSFPNVLRAFDPRNGAELWRCEGLNPLIYTSPIHGEGVVVAMGGFSGTTIAVSPGGTGDVTGLRRLWQSVRTPNRLGSGVVFEGHVYLLNMPGIAECLDLRTGRSIWKERLQGPAGNSESWSSMVRVGNLIYVLNQRGDTTVFKANPAFEIVATNSLNEPTNSSVAVSGGELLIRTHDGLWCIADEKQTAAAGSSRDF